MFKYNFLLDAAADAAVDPAATAGSSTYMLSQLVILGLFIVLLYFVMIRPQKKKEKQIRDMRDALKVGDYIVSNGGIKGKIINIKDDDITIETSVDATKIMFKKWAIREVEQIVD